jgi:cytochrome c-type biogenesis protein CcmH
VAAGDTDEAARQFIVDRYGEFVLLRPVIGWHTVLLWAAAPALLLVGGIAVGIAVLRRRKTLGTESAATPLSADESNALARLERSDPDRQGAASITES